ncbi:DUF4974 domain-containing protein [Sphingobacterium sp. SGG-5]|uniref:FecR family protein n=1 Tax=Sphingobacterium sp. SGG-5 TaxID=2710881 RepID=UPI0013EBD088|nr:FecR family protein [Sphingobacterium sp. SGG-5]NGM61773.1 DUF4974 domain-containing protein [Sphingobacterium sp. SGG-5]
MEAEEKYYRKLVEGYLNKTLTKRELIVFFDLLAQGKLDFYLEEDMVANFPAELDFPTKHFPIKYTWAAIAAVVLIVMGVTFYLNNTAIITPDKVASVATAVQPGGDHAILTLSNGEQIILDNSAQEENIQDGSMSIINNVEGRLQYDLSKVDLRGIPADQLADKYHTIETPRGGTYQIILPDGSKIWLNSLSKIKFPLVFDQNERIVEMEGEVFFDVAKNKNQPFIVRSKGQEITVLGTSFNVNAYSDEPFTRTTLLTGKIELRGTNSKIKLNPGEEVLNTGTNLKIQNADIEQATAWKDGFFRFDKIDIHTLMRQVSRWYNVNIKYVGPVSDERFVGKIKRSEDINELLKIFNQGGMNIVLNGRTILVKN